MNGALRFASFALGAAIASTVWKAVEEGSAPDVRGAAKRGVRVWLTMRSAAAAAQAELEAFEADTQRESEASTQALEPRRRIMVTRQD
jgi:hypothetical protein